ncbi:cellulose binding domain-containing protein [Streptomyces sp. NPDC088097]|uniref:cellulose binding domain-containing protein n=1 Tax=Streptomyces sp. NPDC088097 TaxID=3365823 RepID=UPI003808D1E0
MGSTTGHRRRTSTKAKAAGAIAVAAVIAGAALIFTGTAQAGTVGAVYTKSSSWSGGYTAQYAITNNTAQAQSGWTLEFDLPVGTRIDSLWNGAHTVSGRHVTVKPAAWNGTLTPGASVTVGFAASTTGAATGAVGAPTACRINGAKCSVEQGATPAPGGRPTTAPTATAGTVAPSPSAPTTTPTRTASPSASAPTTASPPPATGTPAGGARFAPYVDTSLYPTYDLVDTATRTGVKEFHLAFVTGGGGCTPMWGGVTDLASDKVAAQIGALRAKGGDVRVSFGGASGSELALNCASADQLAAAYGKVVDQYRLTKVDFDIEGAALPDTAANARRGQAIAALQKSHPGLDVAFTLPVMPEGLTQPGVALLADAKRAGVRIDGVNIMAMDYGPAYSGNMGQYAIQAATATQAQVKGVLGLSDAAAWRAVAVTPMIGVNDVASETFTVADAGRLVEFARSKGIGRLAMWSATRDKQCAAGAVDHADPTCSSVLQEPLAFTKTLGALR